MPKSAKKKAWRSEKGFIGPEFDTEVEIVENGVRYRGGCAKTARRPASSWIRNTTVWLSSALAKDAKVLDCFTHTGSFALNAGLAGAREVLGVDASELGVHQAEKNAGPERPFRYRVKFLCADVFDLLPKLEAEGEKVRSGDPGSALPSRNPEAP